MDQLEGSLILLKRWGVEVIDVRRPGMNHKSLFLNIMANIFDNKK